MYKLFKKHRPPGFSEPEHPFYIAPRTCVITSKEDQWFTRNPVGVKKLGQIMKKMCLEAGLDNNKILTNHATRKTLVSKLRDSGVAPTDIMQISGHKNIQSVLNYSTMSESKHKEISSILTGKNKNEKPLPVRSHTSTNTEVSVTKPSSFFDYVSLFIS